MKRYALLLTAMLLAFPAQALAGPDDYIGDTAIYGGETALVKPNVLIIFDTSGSMGESVDTEVCVPNPDYDDDGIDDIDDNCPFVENPGQEDADNDGVGDVCDASDTDGDGIIDQNDNCPGDANADQADANGNGIGDACEPEVPLGGYDPTKDYTRHAAKYCGEREWKHGSWRYKERCDADKVYVCKQEDWNNGSCDEWKDRFDEIADVNCDGETNAEQAAAAEARDDLSLYGFHLSADYEFEGRRCSSVDKPRRYATGNWIVWFNTTDGGTVFNPSGISNQDYIVDLSPGKGAVSAASTSASSGAMICTTETDTKRNIARKVVEDLVRSTSGVNFGLMRYNGSNGATFVEQRVPDSWDSGNYTSTIKDMTGSYTDTMTNEDALVEVIRALPSSGMTPLGESLFEAMRYLSGGRSAFSAWSGDYPSPINASCQQNYVIFMTDGMSTADDSNVLTSLCGNGDCDHDGNNSKSDSLDDIAKYLHDIDLSDTYAGTQNALTFTIGFGLGGSDPTAVRLLQDAADNGGGKAYLAENYQTLTGALTTIIGQILEVNSSFVAPVVPTNPENKTFSGKRVYLGFFKPVTNTDWQGNLKKFGLNSAGEVVDKNDNLATDANGRFLVTSTSYWSANPDGSNVDEGGVGQELADRDFSTDPRNVYVYTGTQSDLTHASNQFKVDNNDLLASSMGVGGVDERDAIINYVRDGLDVHDLDLDGDTTEKRDWILGDILHSKPVIQAYSRYSLSDESDVTKNGTIIFVGSNDGQIHAFRDADGKEIWSFIPKVALKNLPYLGANNIHNYFMDGSPRVLVWDNDKDGNIGPTAEQAVSDTDPYGADDGSSDKVILIIGMRRGSGVDTLALSQVRGAYYALDVTDPLTPKYLWGIDNTTTGFSELGESWSAVEFGRVRVGGVDRLIAAFGAGYDTNEDLRFGNTQTFPDDSDADTETTLLANDSGDVASEGNAAQFNPKGRGIYILELATLNSAGVPTWHSSPVKLWEYLYTAERETLDPDNNPDFSFPTDLALLDSDFDRNVDLIYGGDTGGQMWRFDLSDKSSTDNWTGTKIFETNPSDVTISDEDPATTGRRILYPPSVVIEPAYIGLYFGTGDRAHPLNKGATDRMYAVYDRGQTTAKTEADLVNVTTDELQAASPAADPDTCTADDNSVKCVLQRLYDPSYYGWFVKLDQNEGEKVLAPAVVFNKVVYHTTYTPNVVTDDPCLSGNLGLGRTYAMNYKTGEAVFNYDLTNDSEYDSNTNDRANLIRDGGVVAGVVLRRSDRHLVMASGIPSGVVIFVRDDGTTGALVGCGGGLCSGDTVPGGTIIPIYWMQE